MKSMVQWATKSSKNGIADESEVQEGWLCEWFSEWWY